MPTVLYLETGASGGGSFESLRHQILGLQGTRYEPIVAFVNRTEHVQALEAEGALVHVVRDPRLSEHASDWERRWTDRILRRVERYLPSLSVPAVRILQHQSVRQLERIIEDEGVDLIHTNVQPMRDLVGVLAAERSGIPLVAHLRSIRGRLPAPVADHVNKNASRFVANSQACAGHYAEQGIDRSRIEVVYNAVPPLDPDPADLQARWNIPPGSHVVVCVANFLPEKGHAFLLEGFARLLEDRSDVHLILVGEGPKRDDVTKQASRLDVEDRVVFTGYLDDPSPVVAAAHILVVPSRNEAFGRTLIEAMRIGTPVVATRVGGIPEVVDDDRTGVLVEHGDPDGLAGQLFDLLEDPEGAEEMADRASHVVRKRFTVDRAVKEVCSIYRELLSEDHPRGGTR